MRWVGTAKYSLVDFATAMDEPPKQHEE